MAEWLRRRIRNPLGSARVGSNPTGVGRQRRNFHLRRPGIEPGPRAWKARILTIELSTLVSLHPARFELAPPKRTELESVALDHSATDAPQEAMAQLAARRIPDPKVGGSNPPWRATIL